MSETLVPCVKCGGVDKSPSGQCRACNRLAVQRYKAKNLDEVRRRNRDHKRALYESQPRHLKKSKKQIASAKAWAKNNPDRCAQYSKKYREKYPERSNIDNHNRRARIKAIGGRLSKDIAKKLFDLQRGKCACCRNPLGSTYELDHIVPLAMGGANVDSNIQLLRPVCNRKKSAKDPIKYMQEKGFLL